jgi:hypothetical protein
MPERTTLDQIAPILAATDRARREREQRFAHLWRMTRAERVAAMWRGELSLPECLAWSARYPQEVPPIGKEFAFIVMRTPEWLGD